MRTRLVSVLSVMCFALLAGCHDKGSNDDGGGDPPPEPAQTISGNVFAPNGTIAFGGPTLSERLVALLASEAHAAASPVAGTTGVVGAAVSLIEIDNTGAAVGSPLATGTTGAGGAFRLDVPSGFAPSAKYIVRATGSTGKLDAIVAQTGELVVDPVSEAATRLVLGSAASQATTLGAIQVGSVAGLQATLADILPRIDFTGATTAAAMANAIQVAAATDVTAMALASSLAARGTVRGRVTDASANGVDGLDVFAIDIALETTRARTRTDASGNYVLNVPPNATGGYVIAVRNAGTASRGASAYFKASGRGHISTAGDPVPVPAGTPVTADVQLVDGGRISGKVIAKDTQQPLAGIDVVARGAFHNNATVTRTRTKPDGSYVLNVPPLVPIVLTLDNSTLQGYAATTYDGPTTGGAAAVEGVAGLARGTVLAFNFASSNPSPSALEANFALAPGKQVAGTLRDGPGTSAQPVGGFIVRIANPNGATAGVVRTDLAGQYRVWLPSAKYVVRARGQSKTVDLSTANAIADFDAVMQSKKVVVRGAGNAPAGSLLVLVYDGATFTFESLETAVADGSAVVYAADSSSQKRIALFADAMLAHGASSVYSGASSLGTGAAVLFDGGTLAPTTLGAGALLSGQVFVGQDPAPTGEYVVEIYSGGTTAANFFVSRRTTIDGGYTLVLAPATYQARACPRPASGAGGACTPFKTATVVLTPDPTGTKLDFSF